jgi:pilus assembly protein CpaB
VIEVTPDDLAKLSLAQRTMYLEIYRSQHYLKNPDIQINDIIRGYNGVTELRGSSSAGIM